MSVFLHVTDVLVIRSVFRQEVLEFIIPGGTKKWVLLSESCQDFLELVVMGNTEIPLDNSMKDVQREDIKRCTNVL